MGQWSVGFFYLQLHPIRSNRIVKSAWSENGKALMGAFHLVGKVIDKASGAAKIMAK